MKLFCNNFKLSKKTFFLALDYLDRIGSIMKAFDFEDLRQISLICIILASKLLENQEKGIKIKKLSSAVSSNYAKDELYILTLLKYDLKTFTCYDILTDALNCGFLFNDEQFSIRKMNSIYEEIYNILYLFSESKYYIDMTHKEIAMSIIGFIRETLGLVAFNKNFQNIFMNKYVNIHNYLSCLNKFKRCFKLKVENENRSRKNSYSESTDSNSDNSDIPSEKLSGKEKSVKTNVNNSIKKDN